MYFNKEIYDKYNLDGKRWSGTSSCRYWLAVGFVMWRKEAERCYKEVICHHLFLIHGYKGYA